MWSSQFSASESEPPQVRRSPAKFTFAGRILKFEWGPRKTEGFVGQLAGQPELCPLHGLPGGLSHGRY